MTGTQALVRLLLVQKARDEAAWLNTGGFVSGYRSSPLGAVDQELWKAKKYLTSSRITFQPGLNEALAATAVWGPQMVNLDPNALVDGVFALWYGKGPGVNRGGSVFKHGNIAGCSKQDGVLLIAGDDHAFIAAMIPVLNPSGMRDFIEFGRQDWHAPVAKLGIVTTGRSYLDVREALTLMGISDDVAKALGLRLLKIGVVWPLEPQCIVEFAQGLEAILVVEEKRQVIEYQLKEHLYNEAHRPRVAGKYDEAGE